MSENSLLTANHIAPVEDEQGVELKLPDMQMQSVVGLIRSRYEDAKNARRVTEAVWLDAYQNYRGVYGKNVKFSKHEKSQIFVKITKTKVLAAYGMLIDVVFGTSEFPIGVQPTKVPDGITDKAHLKTAPSAETSAPEAQPEVVEIPTNPFDVGYEGDGKVLPPGATQLVDSLGGQEEEYTTEAGDVIMQPGKSPDPQVPTINPAKEAGRKMQRLIHDQIEESGGDVEIRNATFECTLLGTGIIKGPYNYNKTLHKWVEDEEGNRTHVPITVRVPRIEFVSCWDLYPDPALTSFMKTLSSVYSLTLAPTPNLFDDVPIKLICSQLDSAGMLLMKIRTFFSPLRLVKTRSSSPSLFRSPTAHP